MKTPERFNNAIKKLTKAFFNGTLGKGNCNACAVGNLCDGYGSWGLLFMTEDGEQFSRIEMLRLQDKEDAFFHFDYKIYEGQQAFDKMNELEEEINCIFEKTGYSSKQLAKIEYAFETNTEIPMCYYHSKPKKEIMNDQFKGLCAVVDVLCEIEGLNTQDYITYFEFDEQYNPVIDF